MSADKQKVMSLDDKVMIIRQFNAITDPSKRSDFRKSSSTIREVIASRKNIMSKYNSMQVKLAAALIIANDKPNYTAEKHAFLEKIIIEWYQRVEIHLGMFKIITPLLIEKTKSVMKFLNIESPASETYIIRLRNNCRVGKAKRTNGFKSLSLNTRKIAMELLERDGIDKEKALTLFGIDILKINDEDWKDDEEDHEIKVKTKRGSFLAHYEMVNKQFVGARESFKSKTTREQISLMRKIIKEWYVRSDENELTSAMIQHQVNIVFLLLGLKGPTPPESWLRSMQAVCCLEKLNSSVVRRLKPMTFKEIIINILVREKYRYQELGNQPNKPMLTATEAVAVPNVEKAEPLLIKIEKDTDDGNQGEAETIEVYEVMSANDIKAECDEDFTEDLVPSSTSIKIEIDCCTSIKSEADLVLKEEYETEGDTQLEISNTIKFESESSPESNYFQEIIKVENDDVPKDG